MKKKLYILKCASLEQYCQLYCPSKSLWIASNIALCANRPGIVVGNIALN
jgi:hypothetical protein